MGGRDTTTLAEEFDIDPEIKSATIRYLLGLDEEDLNVEFHICKGGICAC